MHQLSPDGPGPDPSGGDMPLAEIVVRAHQKDRKAFAVLYERYKEPLGKRLMALVNDQETAYDLYQETFIRVWRYFPGLGLIPHGVTVERFEAWLYSIARNLAIDHLRHAGKLELRSSIFDEDLSDPRTQELAGHLGVAGHEEEVCDLLCLKEALAEMSPQYRTCLLLQVHWGYSQREIAKILSISVRTVSTNVSRGYKQLRTIYTNMMGDRATTKKGGLKRHGRINLRTF